MTNKVWRLAWSDNAEHGEHFSGYTDYTEFVIVAPDEVTARSMAQEHAGETIYSLVDGWTNPHWTTCELVDMGTPSIVGSC